jgi:hypothetical protein
MTGSYDYRLIQPGDGDDILQLVSASPDTGLIGFSYQYQGDPIAIHAALEPGVQGALALDAGQVVGMAFGEPTCVQWAGRVYAAAYLSNLRVLPAFRRRGVARGFADWGLPYIHEVLGPESIVYGAVMEGNFSRSLGEKFGFSSTHAIQGGSVSMRHSPPRRPAGLEFRPATQEELPEIAQAMNDTYRDHDLWTPVTPAGLKDFLEQSVLGIRPNELWVVARENRLLAGFSLSDRTGLVRMQIQRASLPIRLLGGLLGILPRSGELRSLTIRRLWYKEGELEAGQYLWQQARYEFRERGSSLGIAYDPTDRLRQIFRLPPWLPMFKARYLVKGAPAGDTSRPIYCTAGP